MVYGTLLEFESGRTVLSGLACIAGGDGNFAGADGGDRDHRGDSDLADSCLLGRSRGEYLSARFAGGSFVVGMSDCTGMETGADDRACCAGDDWGPRNWSRHFADLFAAALLAAGVCILCCGRIYSGGGGGAGMVGEIVAASEAGGGQL